MSVKVLFFASLRETLGCEVETLEYVPDGIASVGALREWFASRGGDWHALGEGKSVRAAVNQTLAFPQTAIADGDEVAFFPPVTGG